MTELGKSAKRIGHQHPSVLRRIDPVPERATPKAKPQRKADKPFGYAYEWTGMWVGKKKLRHAWFKTAGQRDQAMADFKKKWGRVDWMRLIGPVEK